MSSYNFYGIFKYSKNIVLKDGNNTVNMFLKYIDQDQYEYEYYEKDNLIKKGIISRKEVNDCIQYFENGYFDGCSFNIIDEKIFYQSSEN